MQEGQGRRRGGTVATQLAIRGVLSHFAGLSRVSLTGRNEETLRSGVQ